jgi:hypothetical protein
MIRGSSIAAMHRRSLARFDFDSVLLPYNFFFHQNEHYRRAFDEVLAPAVSATSRSRSSSRSPAARGPRASGRTPPGTSRPRSRPTSTARSTERSASPASSSGGRATRR